MDKPIRSRINSHPTDPNYTGRVVIKKSGIEIIKWYRNGWLHRGDGPALIESTGEEYWYKDGWLHRIGGPAVCMSPNYNWGVYYIEGREFYYYEEYENACKSYLLKERQKKLHNI